MIFKHLRANNDKIPKDIAFFALFVCVALIFYADIFGYLPIPLD